MGTINRRKQLVCSIVFTVCYILIHLHVGLHHEGWRDEGQSWMLAGNTTLFELFSDLCVEGHPALWFLTVRPLVKLGLHFRYLFIISLLLMGVAYFLVLEASPFPYWMRVLFAFNTVFWYFNPVIARVYSEIIPLLIIIAVLYPKRDEYPWQYGVLLFFLSQTHLLFEGILIGLVIERFTQSVIRKQKTAIIPLVFGFFGGTFALLEVFPREGTKRAVDVSFDRIVGNVNNSQLSLHFDEVTQKLYGFTGGWNREIVLVLLLLWFFSLLISVITGKTSKTEKMCHIFLLIISASVPLLIEAFVYGATHVQIATCYLIIIIFMTWVLLEKNQLKWLKIAVLFSAMVLLLMSFPTALSSMSFDLRGNYSNSRDASDMIIASADKNAVVLVENTEYNSPVCCYVSSEREDISFYSITEMEAYKYHVWGGTYSPTVPLEAEVLAVNVFYDKTVYVLRAVAYTETDPKIKMIGAFDGYTPTRETYYLYLVSPSI